MVIVEYGETLMERKIRLENALICYGINLTKNK